MTDAPHVFPEQINEYVSGCIRVEKKNSLFKKCSVYFPFF